MTKKYYLEASAGNETANAEVIHKFGSNTAVGTSLEPISFGGIYRTPQVSGATKLRVKAGNANDSSGGTGAQSVKIEGLNALGERISEVIITNGISAGADSVNTYVRLYRSYVYGSGTYATSTSPSHAAQIVVENAAGTEDWSTIPNGSMSTAQSEIGVFTVPKGKQAYVIDAKVSVDTTKVTSITFFKRENILQTTAPYSAMRKQFGAETVIRDYIQNFDAPHGPFLELTDIGFMAKVVSGTATVNVEFSILLRDKE